MVGKSRGCWWLGWVEIVVYRPSWREIFRPFSNRSRESDESEVTELKGPKPFKDFGPLCWDRLASREQGRLVHIIQVGGVNRVICTLLGIVAGGTRLSLRSEIFPERAAGCFNESFHSCT